MESELARLVQACQTRSVVHKARVGMGWEGKRENDIAYLLGLVVSDGRGWSGLEIRDDVSYAREKKAIHQSKHSSALKQRTRALVFTFVVRVLDKLFPRTRRGAPRTELRLCAQLLSQASEQTCRRARTARNRLPCCAAVTARSLRAPEPACRRAS